MYDITPYTLKQALRIGVTVKPSHTKKKKIDVFKDGKLIGSVGAIEYPDYPTYVKTHGKEYADKRRELYHKRHTKNTMGEYLAKTLLW
jgi:hypothetical protein